MLIKVYVLDYSALKFRREKTYRLMRGPNLGREHFFEATMVYVSLDKKGFLLVIFTKELFQKFSQYKLTKFALILENNLKMYECYQSH